VSVAVVWRRQTGLMALTVAWRWEHFWSYPRSQPPGFVWYATLHGGPIPILRARDMYCSGQGRMLIKAASMVTVADAKGSVVPAPERSGDAAVRGALCSQART
jgi:hypothetical protein